MSTEISLRRYEFQAEQAVEEPIIGASCAAFRLLNTAANANITRPLQSFAGVDAKAHRVDPIVQ